MKKIINTLFTIMTIGIAGCQSILPAQLNVSDAAQNYTTDSSQLVAAPSGTESLDGIGNNIANPNWGSVNEHLLRMSPVAYTDGVSSPSGANRPSARTASNTFSVSPADGIPNDRDYTAFVYAWGQFLDHDIDLTESATPKEPFPIVVPTGDEWFDPSKTGTMTIPMSRSKYDVSTGTSAENPREQTNSITAFVDGSQVYGMDATRAATLREFVGGRMKVSDGNLLPFNTDGLPNANDAHRVADTELFLAGDVRANENPELISLQTLFVREHNRIAAEAEQQHPDWTDEQLYQYARSIVIAELQKITYAEFLPAILGPNAIPAYQGYQANVNPDIATEFSTAAFRLGHSMLGADIEFLDNNRNEVRDAMLLRDAFFNSTVVTETNIDPILKYLASDNAQEIDTIVVDDVRNFLFGAPGQGGFDLASLNIQRGRDHGIADYNTVRVAYGLPRITSFEQITSDASLQASLAATYGSVDNIDLWIGGLAEDHLPNSSVGATFTAIIVDQFTRLRDGDRFWYQNSLPKNTVRDIQNTSMADIIRLNTGLTKLQENVFFFNEATTVIVDTTSTPTVAPQAQNEQQGNNQQGNGPQNGRRPSQASLNACANLAADAACSFIGRNQNTINGTCQVVQNSQLACVRNNRP
ncbi:MAG: peroxidase family protein [Anaerolineales bacterium]